MDKSRPPILSALAQALLHLPVTSSFGNAYLWMFHRLHVGKKRMFEDAGAVLGHKIGVLGEQQKMLRQAVASQKSGFTLIEIMIVIAITGIVIAIAAPTWFRQREQSRARACVENLTKIDGAKEQYALEFRLANGEPTTFANLITPNGAAVSQGYLKIIPTCPASGNYTTNNVGDDPTCSIGTTNSPFPPHQMP